MIDETHLVAELGTLELRTRGPALAGVWLVTGGIEFPMAGWSDFIVVVLGWWSGAILRLMRNSSEKELVHFMDGPYAVEISKVRHGALHLRMFAGPSEGREVGVGEADLKRFVSHLAAESRQLLEECKSRGWWSTDAEALASHLKDLDDELASW